MVKEEELRATVEELEAEESKVAPLLEKLAALIQDENLDEDEVRHVAEDPYFVRRCLIACLNDDKKAYKMAATGLRWRSKTKPTKITMDDFPTAASQGIFSLSTHAKNGWPVVFCYAVKWNPWRYSTAEYSRMITYIMEACEAAMDPNDPYARIYFVFDMKGMSKLMADLRKIAEATKFAATYYPERIVPIAINADWVTFALWNFMKPLLDKRTADRVTLVRNAGLDVLDEHVGLDKVGPSIGGTRSEEWPSLSAPSRKHYKWSVDATGAPSTTATTAPAATAIAFKKQATDNTEVSTVEEELPVSVVVQG
eukprot:scaffold6925_cov180-Amphora_coffeaeformis.AAC.8